MVITTAVALPLQIVFRLLCCMQNTTYTFENYLSMYFIRPCTVYPGLSTFNIPRSVNGDGGNGVGFFNDEN